MTCLHGNTRLLSDRRPVRVVVGITVVLVVEETP